MNFIDILSGIGAAGNFLDLFKFAKEVKANKDVDDLLKPLRQATYDLLEIYTSHSQYEKKDLNQKIEEIFNAVNPIFFPSILEALSSLSILKIQEIIHSGTISLRNPSLSVIVIRPLTKKDLEEIRIFIIEKGCLDMYLASRFSLPNSK